MFLRNLTVQETVYFSAFVATVWNRTLRGVASCFDGGVTRDVTLYSSLRHHTELLRSVCGAGTLYPSVSGNPAASTVKVRQYAKQLQR